MEHANERIRTTDGGTPTALLLDPLQPADEAHGDGITRRGHIAVVITVELAERHVLVPNEPTRRCRSYMCRSRYRRHFSNARRP